MNSKRIVSSILSLCMMSSFYPLKETDGLNMKTYAAEDADAEISVQDLEELIASVPEYLGYYTDDSVKDLKKTLDVIAAVNPELWSSAQLQLFYNSLKNEIECLEYKTAEVPQIYISTLNNNGNTIVKDDGYVDTKIAIVDSEGNVISDDEGLIKVRGNSTATAPKKPFTIKFSSKQNVLDMGKAKKWVLLANCFDPTLIRNDLAFDFAEYMGLAYTSERKWTELWVDGVFKGCYLLVEPVETGKTRVDIDAEKGDDFLIEYEKKRVDEGDFYLESNGYRFVLSEPEEPTEERVQEIQSRLDEITAAINSEDYDTFMNYIDIESFVKYYILNEYFKTLDFGYSSVYYYYKNDKLYAGPAWDYDLSSGNCNAAYSADYKNKSLTTGIVANLQLYSKLCKSEQFMTKVKSQYAYYQSYIMSITEEGGLIDSIVNNNKKVIDRNFGDAKWSASKQYSAFMRVPEATYSENIEFLREWLVERNEWLCKQWNISTVMMNGASLVLDGTLGLNIYVSLSDDVLNSKNVEMKFSVANGENPIEVTAKLDRNNTEIIDGKVNYIFRCNIPAKNMYSEISAKLVAGGKETEIDTKKLTAAKYAEVVKEKNPDAYGELIDAMLAYGNNADAYWSVSGKKMTAYTEKEYADIARQIGEKSVSMGRYYYGSSLILESDTVLRHYYTKNDGTMKAKGSYFYKEEKTAPSRYASNDAYSVNDYIYKVLTSDDSDENLKNLCTALYKYGAAAAGLGGKN